MSLQEITHTLELERESLRSELDKVEGAIKALNGTAVLKAAERKPTKKRKPSREELEAKAIEHYGAEAVTCPECGKVSTRPQGMSAHLRSHSAQ